MSAGPSPETTTTPLS